MPETSYVGVERQELESSLHLTHAGTRFADEAMEARYRAWRVDASIPFNRFAIQNAAVNWLVAVVVVLLSQAETVRVAGTLSAIVMVSLALAFSTTKRRSLHAWIQPATALSNAVIGLVVVAWAQPERHVSGQAALALTVMLSYGGFAVIRVPPLHAVIATAPYVVLAGVLDARQVRQHGAGADAALDVFVLLSSFSTGLLINLVLDIASRRSFRQERIIEAQKEMIATERARSEGLLKQELSHQVAERSREIGDALSRGALLTVKLPAPGDRFHTRYRVMRILGEGGMGAVFEVERLTDDRRLALKVVTGSVSGAAAARFAREAEIGARVQHPNIVSIVDVGIAEGAPFLVMDLITGGSLENQRRRFGDVDWALPILRQIAVGLSELHRMGVVHRDLKPGNVLLDGEPAAPVAKISDFGISRFRSLDEVAPVDAGGATLPATPQRQNLTGTGVVLGTPFYMAPEAIRGGRAVETAADLFAFGIVAYEMLTGGAPYDPPAALVPGPLPVPTLMDGARLGAVVRDTILACLAEDPRVRPTATQVVGALSPG